MNDPLISVIIPVYRVEPYLDRCVKSVVGQTYRNLEILLVDDGSPDRCPQMCDDWAKKDDRIRVIHKPNGGLSDARNAGMTVAKGDYIGFVDSDDWIAPNFYEVLLRKLLTNHAGIAAADVIWAFEDHEERRARYTQTVFTPEQALTTIMKGEGFHATAWNKLYQTEIIRKFPYPKGRIHEDEFVTFRAIAAAGTLVLCQDTAYYYWQRTGSIMNSNQSGNLDAIDAFWERLMFFQQAFPNLYHEDKPHFCVLLVQEYRNCLKDGKTESCERLKQYRRNIHYSFSEILRYTWKQKAYVIGSACNMKLMAQILNKR